MELLTKVVLKDLSTVLVKESPRHISDKIINSHILIDLTNNLGKSEKIYINQIASFNMTVGKII